MNDATPHAPRRILVVEDDASMQRQLADLFQRYGDALAVTFAENAGEALVVLETAEASFDALVLDLMMPYGDAREKLAAGGDRELDTGLHLLEHVRQHTPAGAPVLWVVVITARSGLAVARRVDELLAKRGKLYLKPFDTHQFEHDVMRAVGVPSQVSPDLLPDDETSSAEDRP